MSLHAEIRRIYLKTRTSVDEYAADMAVAAGYCAECRTRKRKTGDRRCSTCSNGGPEKVAARMRERRAAKKEKTA